LLDLKRRDLSKEMLSLGLLLPSPDPLLSLFG
jgi:hypothetical protein